MPFDGYKYLPHPLLGATIYINAALEPEQSEAVVKFLPLQAHVQALQDEGFRYALHVDSINYWPPARNGQRNIGTLSAFTRFLDPINGVVNHYSYVIKQDGVNLLYLFQVAGGDATKHRGYKGPGWYVLALDETRISNAGVRTGLPGGLVNPGESFIAAGRRELREETRQLNFPDFSFMHELQRGFTHPIATSTDAVLLAVFQKFDLHRRPYADFWNRAQGRLGGVKREGEASRIQLMPAEEFLDIPDTRPDLKLAVHNAAKVLVTPDVTGQKRDLSLLLQINGLIGARVTFPRP